MTLNSFAGTIESRSSLDSLSFEVDSENEELLVLGTVKGESVSRRLPLERHARAMNETKVDIYDVGLFGLPFGRVQDGLRILSDEDVKNPFLMASLMTLTLALDIAGLPFDLIDGGLSNMAINKDVRILKKAVAKRDYERKVGQKRFDRICGYLDLK